MSSESTLDVFEKVAAKQDAAQRAVANADMEPDPDGMLDVLLSAEPAEQIVTYVLDPRKGTDKEFVVTLRSVKELELKSYRKQAEVPMNRAERRTKKRTEEPEVDDYLLGRLLIRHCTTNFNWNDAKLREHYGVMTGEDVVGKVLLYGEVVNLSNFILKISGFDDDAIRVAEDLSDGEEKP